MFVKICGTTNLEDARLSVDAGADALGFIFAPSKRRVTVEQVAAITRELPPGVGRVGVFTAPEVAEIAATVRGAGLTAVQMHWRYQHAPVGALRRALGPDVELWQVVGYPVELPPQGVSLLDSFAQRLHSSMVDADVDRVLLDTEKGGASGGLGQVFSWVDAAPVVKEVRQRAWERAGAAGARVPHLLVAGGLTADNAADAIAALQPEGVDVVSGVEASPGRKSPDRLRAFLAAAKGLR